MPRTARRASTRDGRTASFWVVLPSSDDAGTAMRDRARWRFSSSVRRGRRLPPCRGTLAARCEFEAVVQACHRDVRSRGGTPSCPEQHGEQARGVVQPPWWCSGHPTMRAPRCATVSLRGSPVRSGGGVASRRAGARSRPAPSLRPSSRHVIATFDLARIIHEPGVFSGDLLAMRRFASRSGRCRAEAARA